MPATLAWARMLLLVCCWSRVSGEIPAGGEEPQPVRFHIDYQLSGLPNAAQQQLQDAVSVAIGVTAGLVKVKHPVSGRLLLAPRCVTPPPTILDTVSKDNTPHSTYHSHSRGDTGKGGNSHSLSDARTLVRVQSSLETAEATLPDTDAIAGAATASSGSEAAPHISQISEAPLNDSQPSEATLDDSQTSETPLDNSQISEATLDNSQISEATLDNLQTSHTPLRNPQNLKALHITVEQSSTSFMNRNEGHPDGPMQCMAVEGDFTDDAIAAEGGPFCSAQLLLGNLNPSFYRGYTVCPGGDESCRSFSGGKGEEADIYLYVTAVDIASCANSIAFSHICDGFSGGQPQEVMVNICPMFFDMSAADAFDLRVEVLVHELIHLLAFHPLLFPRFVNELGQPWDHGPMGMMTQAGQVVPSIQTPAVVAAAREHFGCPSLIGVPLEDEGGSGVAGAHWETRLFLGEALSAQPADLGIGSGRRVVSNITLALFQDTGWYEPNWSAAGWLDWGRGAGCDFVQLPCAEFLVKDEEEAWFCQPDQPGAAGTTCTADHSAAGSCRRIRNGNGCHVRAAQPAPSYGSFGSCQVPDAYGTVSGDTLWRYGSDSRCYICPSGVWNSTDEQLHAGFSSTSLGSFPSAYCLKSSCKDGVLYVHAGTRAHTCDSKGQVKLDGGGLQGSFRCPSDAALVCESLSCKGHCSGNGLCRQGQCYCKLTASGEDCSQSLMPTSALTVVQSVSAVQHMTVTRLVPMSIPVVTLPPVTVASHSRGRHTALALLAIVQQLTLLALA